MMSNEDITISLINDNEIYDKNDVTEPIQLSYKYNIIIDNSFYPILYSNNNDIELYSITFQTPILDRSINEYKYKCDDKINYIKIENISF